MLSSNESREHGGCRFIGTLCVLCVSVFHQSYCLAHARAIRGALRLRYTPCRVHLFLFREARRPGREFIRGLLK